MLLLTAENKVVWRQDVSKLCFNFFKFVFSRADVFGAKRKNRKGKFFVAH